MFSLAIVQCRLAPRTAWGGWSKRAFQLRGMWPCITLGSGCVLSLASEWWSWEIVGLVSSRLGTNAIAAQAILLQSSSLTYQLPFSVSVATSVRVGNLLGARRDKDAMISAYIAMGMALLVGIFNSSILFFFRKNWSVFQES